MTAFPMLSRVKIWAIKGGNPEEVVGEIVGYRPPNYVCGEAYDVLLPIGSVTQQAFRGDGGGHDRVSCNVPPSELKSAGDPTRAVTFRAEVRYPTDRIVGWPLHVGRAA